MADFKNIIFLDFDGVLNCELFYRERFANVIDDKSDKKIYRQVKNSLKTKSKPEEYTKEEWDAYYKAQLCPVRVGYLNDLCKDTDSVIVVSSTWRMGHTVERLQEILNTVGATFKVIDKTPHTGYARGTEIAKWLDDNCKKYFGVHSFDFYRYAIIDDDSDMLLGQAMHFFQTDSYSGLTPNTVYKIKRFFTHKTF